MQVDDTSAFSMPKSSSRQFLKYSLLSKAFNPRKEAVRKARVAATKESLTKPVEEPAVETPAAPVEKPVAPAAKPVAKEAAAKPVAKPAAKKPAAADMPWLKVSQGPRSAQGKLAPKKQDTSRLAQAERGRKEYRSE
jgi:hypothetical protein